MVQLKTNVRVRAEGSGITAKSIVTFLVLLYDVRQGDKEGRLALLAFALGQLAYSLTCVVVYLAYFGVKKLIPQINAWVLFDADLPGLTMISFREKKSTFVDPQLFRLSATMTWQSIVKHVLTEGDKFILSWFSPLQDQGGYALAVNYGGCIDTRDD